MFAQGPSRVLQSNSALAEQKSHFGRSATIISLTKNPLPLLVSLYGLVGIAESIRDLMVGTEPNLPFFYLLKSKWRDRENLSKRLNQCWMTAEPAEQATFAISDFAITISEDG